MSAATDSSTALRLIERYSAAWTDHDLDAILSMHAPGMVLERDLEPLLGIPYRAPCLYVWWRMHAIQWEVQAATISASVAKWL